MAWDVLSRDVLSYIRFASVKVIQEPRQKITECFFL